MFWLLWWVSWALGRTPIDLMKLVCGGFVGSVFLHDQIAHICFLSPQKNKNAAGVWYVGSTSIHLA